MRPSIGWSRDSNPASLQFENPATHQVSLKTRRSEIPINSYRSQFLNRVQDDIVAPSRPMTAIFSLKIEVRLGIYLGELGRWVFCQNFKVDLCTPARAVRHAGIPIGDFDGICQHFLITVDE